MPEQKRYARDPEKHRAIARKSYHAHRGEINNRRKERRDRKRAAKGILVDPATVSRMAAMREVPRRDLQQSWTKNLFAKMDAIITDDFSSDHAKSLRCAFRLILTQAEQSGLTQERDIKPGWLADFPRQTKDLRKEPIYRSGFGRMLLRLEFWSEDDYQLFCKILAASRRGVNPGRRAHGPKPAPSPPDELRQLVREMARCGISMAQMRELRVGCIHPDGLRIPGRPKSEKRLQLVTKRCRFIPFGSGRDELRKTILDAYIRKENPTDYLFFSRSPRDKKKPLSKMTLNGAVIASAAWPSPRWALRPAHARSRRRPAIQALCFQHFDEDFKRARSLQEAHFHLCNVHDLDNGYVHNLIAGSKSHRGYANEAETIPVPEPYLLAAMCASRSVPKENAKSTIPEGGKRHLTTWRGLFGYEITVDWTRGFAKELDGDGQKRVKALRLLCRLAFDFWLAGRRMKLPDIKKSEIRPRDKKLLQKFAVTTVTIVSRRHPQASWTGSLFEYDTRKRSFRIPLIEDMNRRAWHNQCQVCWHPERDSIEREISEADTKQSRKKGYHLIASKYGISNQSLAAHRGRKSPAKGRGETQRSHFSSGSMAPILRCPRSFFKQLPTLSAMDLMIYSLVLLEPHSAESPGPGLIVPTELVKQRLDLRLDNYQLSRALNHLGPTGLALVDFKKKPTGFYVELLRSLTKSTSFAA